MSIFEHDFIQQIQTGKLDVVEWLSQQNEDTIRARVYERVPDELDTSVGSYLYDAIEPGNAETAVAYFALQHIILLAFPQYSFGEWLTLHAAAKGVLRNSATYSTGVLSITAESGTTIPAGTQFSNIIPEGSGEDVRYYISQETVIVPQDGKAYVSVVSTISGKAGNAAAGEISMIVDDITGIESISNQEPLDNGVDEESDTSLLDRLLERARNPSGSGNKKDYKKWAKEVPGVVDADVIPLHDGPGTVKVIIVGENGEPIPGVIEAVKEYLDPSDHEGEGEGCATIGAVVTVTTVENIVINIEITDLEIKSNYTAETVQSNIKTALITAIASVSIGGLVRKRAVEDAVLHAAGVEDFDQLLMNGESKNIQVEPHLKAKLGEVFFSE